MDVPGREISPSAFSEVLVLYPHGKRRSVAFIDASMLIQPLGLGTDFCDAIYKLLTGYQGEPIYPLAGAVIDARGITTNLTCT